MVQHPRQSLVVLHGCHNTMARGTLSSVLLTGPLHRGWWQRSSSPGGPWWFCSSWILQPSTGLFQVAVIHVGAISEYSYIALMMEKGLSEYISAVSFNSFCHNKRNIPYIDSNLSEKTDEPLYYRIGQRCSCTLWGMPYTGTHVIGKNPQWICLWGLISHKSTALVCYESPQTRSDTISCSTHGWIFTFIIHCI